MTGWQERLAPLVRKIEKGYDALKYRLYQAMGGPGPIQILPYRGYGSEKQVHLKGRVLVDREIPPPGEGDTTWENLVNVLKRVDSREIPHARLRARFQGIEKEIVADEEGMFDLFIEPVSPPSGDTIWHPVELELLEPRSPRQEGPVRATGKVLIPPPSRRLGVISDIDDTVIQTEATNLLRMARNVLLESAHTRLPFSGVAALYRALHAGPSGTAQNPLFYVSNGLWNLYDVLITFFHLQDIPDGPILLRNWGIYKDEMLPTEQREHKLGLIRPILETYPDLSFILIGDSGEADPEIYHQVVHEHPGRILAVYIRNVDPSPERVAAIRTLADEVLDAGSSLVLAEDSLVMARHAAREGWIGPQGLEEIRLGPAEGRG